MLYRDDFVKEVLNLYVAGVTILDIANFTGATIADVNEVIDSYSPHM